MSLFSLVRFRVGLVFLVGLQAAGSLAEPVGRWADNTLVLDNGARHPKSHLRRQTPSTSIDRTKVIG